MTSKKKSFVLHKDSLDILPDLTDDQAGKLFKAIYAYQIDEEINLDQIIKMVFLPFKNQFVRDDSKYIETCERRAVAGAKGGKQKVANASKCKQKVAKVAESVNDSGSDKDSDSESVNKVTIDRFAEFWDLYAKKTGKPKCEGLWKKLSQVDIDLIFKTLPAYIFAKPDKQFRKDPERWLKNKCWNDEVINNERNQNNGPKLSAYERVKQRNDELYRQPNECELGVGADGGYLGGAVDQGERGETIEQLDNEPFIDYEQPS